MTARSLLAGSLRGRRRELWRLAGWSTLEALPAFLSGRLVAEAVDGGFLADDPGRGLAWLGVLAVAVLVGAVGTRQTYLVIAGLVEPFRDDLVRVVAASGVRRPHGASVARLTEQVEISREALASVLMVTQGFIVMSVSALLGLLTLAPVLLAFVLPPLVAGLALFAAALRPLAAAQRTAILAEERIAAETGSAVRGLRDVVACGGEERVAAAAGVHIDAHARAMRELARLTAVRTISVGIGGWLPVILIVAAGPWLVRNGVSTGALLGALTYVAQGVHGALQTLVRGIGGVGLWLVVALSRIAESAVEPAGLPPAHVAPQGALLSLRGVTFAHGPGARPVVADLSLEVPEGDHVAVVGPSGAGKSTLAALIAGILTPDEGEVRLGGVRTAGLAAAHVALIPQEAYVFTGSLRENLTYLRPSATDAELLDAAETLGARDLVDALGGLDARVEPGRLSAGGRQLITLVRAYVSDARLVVLDEATCHLDPAAEARVEQAFAARPGTLIVMAHRITSAQRAGIVVVLDGDRVTIGTHPGLAALSPLYGDLVGHWDAPARDRALSETA